MCRFKIAVRTVRPYQIGVRLHIRLISILRLDGDNNSRQVSVLSNFQAIPRSLQAATDFSQETKDRTLKICGKTYARSSRSISRLQLMSSLFASISLGGRCRFATRAMPAGPSWSHLHRVPQRQKPSFHKRHGILGFLASTTSASATPTKHMFAILLVAFASPS